MLAATTSTLVVTAAQAAMPCSGSAAPTMHAWCTSGFDQQQEGLFGSRGNEMPLEKMQLSGLAH